MDLWSESISYPFRGRLYNFLGLNHQGGSISKKLFWKELKNEVSIQLMTSLFRFHTLQNFHLTFDLRQLSKISSFYPFLSNRKNVSTVAFSPKMRNKLRGWRFGPSIWAHQKMTFVDLNFETFIKNHLSKKLKDRIAEKAFLISAVRTLSLERLNGRFKIFTTLVQPKMLTLHFLIPQRLKLNLFWQKSYISYSM